ncbi:hypothetical protein SDRG_00029 [Saprolegnia diclina VS20]|uniref:Uncharacterized protein n=1 Tax=Saprolegnia diclina (strain VS20) TaxID=1156394 RepID=T0R758_SAPDV|nr:hypothetical protein SDRG_00029 [Saprolegnia diclina VS20]EQC42290.1 hypothetical protein SDRG_00029 [Saprolegnia diclina VS20]|eukprot:XP_008603713.1 hypothetical protein SDRG_00029 [Saprolegnia diclina VS20]
MFTGPRLECLDGLSTWQPAFLAASDATMTAYYTRPHYQDATIVDTIGPARLHELQVTVNAAMPDVPDDLTPAQREGAEIMRQRHLDARLKDAIASECSEIRSQRVQYACEYLLSAIAPSLHPHVAPTTDPYGMWQRLTAAASNDVGSLQRAYAKVTDMRFQAKRPNYEAPGDFFQRFDAAVDPFLEQLLTSPADVDAPAVAAYKTALTTKLKCVLLAHASGPHDASVLSGLSSSDVARVQIHLLPSMAKASARPMPSSHMACAYCGYDDHRIGMCRQHTLDWENRNFRTDFITGSLPFPTIDGQACTLAYVPRTASDEAALMRKGLIRKYRGKRKEAPATPVDIAEKRQLLEERCMRRSRTSTL